MDKYGQLTIISIYKKPRKPRGNREMAVCICECGNYKTIQLDNLKSSHTTSCGCHKTMARFKHGYSHHPLYKVWEGIVNRCCTVTSSAYKYYGGRGIKICDEWRKSPKAFVEWGIENNWAIGLTIDRQNNDGDYEPNNCRLVSQLIQAGNTSKNRLFTINGETKCLSRWASEYGIDKTTLVYRINVGMEIEEALKTVKKIRSDLGKPKQRHIEKLISKS